MPISQEEIDKLKELMSKKSDPMADRIVENNKMKEEFSNDQDNTEVGGLIRQYLSKLNGMNAETETSEDDASLKALKQMSYTGLSKNEEGKELPLAGLKDFSASDEERNKLSVGGKSGKDLQIEAFKNINENRDDSINKDVVGNEPAAQTKLWNLQEKDQPIESENKLPADKSIPTTGIAPEAQQIFDSIDSNPAYLKIGWNKDASLAKLKTIQDPAQQKAAMEYAKQAMDAKLAQTPDNTASINALKQLSGKANDSFLPQVYKDKIKTIQMSDLSEEEKTVKINELMQEAESKGIQVK